MRFRCQLTLIAAVLGLMLALQGCQGGGIPPLIFQMLGQVDKPAISQGDPLTVTVTIKNIWDRRIDFSSFPKTMSVRQQYVEGSEMEVPLEGSEATPQSLNPGDTTTVVAHLSPDTTHRLQPGRYFVYLHLEFDSGARRRDQGPDLFFLVKPAEGALVKAVEVNSVVDVRDVAMTLKTVRFTSEETTITLFAVPSGNTTTASPIDSPFATARYRLDDGPWLDLRKGTVVSRETPEGTNLQSTLGPVPATAHVLEFAVVTFRGNPRPDETVTGPWEWSIPLG